MMPRPALLRPLPLALLVVTAIASCAADRAPTAVTPPAPMPPPGDSVRAPLTIPVRIGEHVVQAELASTLDARARGLMGRPQLPDTTAMLFVWPYDLTPGFWMKDTPIDLSIAFVDRDRRIINIAAMTRNDSSTFHYPLRPARYALEVRRGWFSDRGIGTDAVLEFTLPAGLRIDP
jgi:uncharacterized protein